ncbi:hypothetical protein FSP39_007050 [Pinctada imbricata]|uniref:Uncharacterized protein n=1 Tax=Pinctada imbricata TaxID=66713 RepID=A0AA88XMT8_PINIB|nr:hypothetical protein FSP39_007050 [Pinctada imbricata]
MDDAQYPGSARCVLVLQFVVLEVLDLIFDWNFYTEVSDSKDFKEKPISRAIFVFALWGTALFVADFICLLLVVCKGKPSKAEDIVTCLTTWTEDVPQIVMAVIVASTVGKPITGWVQYTKAALGISESIIRIMVTIMSNCCIDSYKYDQIRSQRCCPSCADTLNFIGYFIILICAIVILAVFAR